MCKYQAISKSDRKVKETIEALSVEKKIWPFQLYGVLYIEK